MTDRELMQQALDAFDLHAEQYPHMVKGYTWDAANDLRARLAQPDEQFCDTHCTWRDHHPDCERAQPDAEPVAWMYDFRSEGDLIVDWLTTDRDEAYSGHHQNIRPLYAAPQPAAEPVAWMQDTTAGLYVADQPDQYHTVPLYPAPQPARKWQGLSDAEVDACFTELEPGGLGRSCYDVYRAIESALKERNHG